MCRGYRGITGSWDWLQLDGWTYLSRLQYFLLLCRFVIQVYRSSRLDNRTPLLSLWMSWKATQWIPTFHSKDNYSIRGKYCNISAIGLPPTLFAVWLKIFQYFIASAMNYNWRGLRWTACISGYIPQRFNQSIFF
jgi:hypothetical protein